VRILSVGNRFPPWSSGGYEATWAGVVQALRDAGHDVRVLTTRPDPSDRAPVGAPPPDVHRELRWYWRAHRFPRRTVAQCVALERANAAVLAAHRRAFAPDVVMWWAMGGMSLSLLEQVRRAGLPALGMVCDDWMLYGPEVDGWTRRWRGLRRGLAPVAERITGTPCRLDLDRAANWAFISRYALDAARAGGWRLPGAFVAHAGIDGHRFHWDPPGDWRWRLLYCGRVDPRKGVATAIQSLPKLPDEATLTIKGDGDRDHLDELRALATRLGVPGRVRFEPGSVEDVADAYAASDAVVFPVTWREPWGLVPLEAMAVGRPVLATRAGGGAAEYLEDEVNCLQFEPRDADGLAAAFTRLAANATLREAVRVAGRETAGRFTDRHLHEQLERQLLATSASARR
jgi:glycogen synthase